jgi:hypothetical protein
LLDSILNQFNVYVNHYLIFLIIYELGKFGHFPIYKLKCETLIFAPHISFIAAIFLFSTEALPKSQKIGLIKQTLDKK